MQEFRTNRKEGGKNQTKDGQKEVRERRKQARKEEEKLFTAMSAVTRRGSSI